MVLGHRVLVKLQGSHENPVREGKEKQEGYYNYFIGNDPSKYATFVGLYKEAVIKNVYDGIDLRYYFDGGRLRYDYIVHAGADPKQIVFTIEGSEATYVDEKGNLVFTTRFGEVSMAGLKVYQERDGKEVAARFVEKEGNWSIWVGNYDKSQVLVIDPLIYSTYVGGNDYDRGFGIAIDGSGNAYVTGGTYSTDYDVTAGAYQTTYGGGRDVFVTKLNASGSGLLYSTYLGGSDEDESYGIAIDGSGNAYVTGSTQSTDYPVTAGAYQTTYAGEKDVFVTKLNASGSGLWYSTYLGGSDGEVGYVIAVDGSGNAYVTGWTGSTNFPVTTGAYQTTHGGGSTDVFVTKIGTCTPPMVTATASPATICAGQSSTLTASGASTYSWSSGQNTSYISVTPTSTTTYTVTGTDTNGCSNTVEVTVTVYPLPTVVASATPNPVCEGGQTTLSASGASSYVWDEGLEGGLTHVVSPSSTTTYVVTGTDDNGCSNTAKVTVTVQPNNTITLIAGEDSQAVCVNTPIANIIYSTTGATGATFSGFPTGVTGTFSNNSIIVSGTPTQTGTFNYTVTLTGGCGNVTASGKIVVNGCSGIEYMTEGGGWSIYPNPSTGNFTLQSEREGTFELMDICGRIIKTFTIQNATEQIQINLPSGVYFIREKETGFTQKLVIE